MPRPIDKLDRVVTKEGTLFSNEYLLTCIACKEAKLFTDFYPDKYSKNGYRSKCKKCPYAYSHTPEYMENKRIRLRKSRKEDPCRFIYYAAKNRALNEGLPFNIEIDDIVIPEKCPVLGITLKTGDGIPQDCSPSLDKIDPALGYTKLNIWIISFRANAIKRDASLEELELLVAALKQKKQELATDICNI